MSSFGKKYAQIYDILYAQKDYKNEVDLIERLIKEQKPQSKNILDYGCGSCNHAKVLALRGYKIFCLDNNENMLEIAREKIKGSKNIQLYHTDNREKIKPNSIDVCLALFDVVSYMDTNKELNDFFSYVKKRLVKDGLFVFDFWYGPGVINLKPEKRWKEYKTDNKEILRLTKPDHDLKNSIVNITHEIIVYNQDKILDRFTDEHHMRYFFKNELELLLSHHQFKIIKFGTLWDIDSLPTINDWSALIVCQPC